MRPAPVEMTRDEHLKWCKNRALEYLQQGNLTNAVASMGSDLGKHADTQSLVANPYLLLLGMQHVLNHDIEGVRRWIEGFN